MAIRDWNGNGKKDWADNVIEYQIYKNMRDHKKNTPTGNSSGSSGGMSTIGAILCTISGLFWETLLFMLLDIEVDNVPGILLFILWIVFSALTTAAVYKLRG